MVPSWYNLNQRRRFPFLETSAAVAAPFLDAGIVLGGQSEFVSGADTVALARLEKTLTTLTLIFTSTAPGLAGHRLAFSVELDAETPATLWAEDPALVGSLSAGECEDLHWWGFLVVQALDELAALVAEDALDLDPPWVLEPACLQNLAGAYVTSLNVANFDRTRATAPPDCPPFEWPHPLQDIWVERECIQEPLYFAEGFHLRIEQVTAANTLNFYPGVRPGFPLPCAEIPLFDGEVPPPWSPYLDGSTPCYDTIRSLGGAGGPHLDLTSSGGVSITTDPDNHRVIVAVDFSGLVVCPVSEEEV